jgi:hypothetical protein
MERHGGEEIAQIVGDLGAGGISRCGIVRGDDELRHGPDLACRMLRSAAVFEHEADDPANAVRLLNS